MSDDGAGDMMTDDSEGDTASDDGGSDDGPIMQEGFAISIEPIVNASCVAGCHEAGGLNESLILSPGEAYDNLVGKMSGQLPQMLMVNPGDKSTSYMWHKLNNTHIAEGGSGAQMPYSGMPLPANQLILIGDWIDEGAEP